jgi:hypothetical protein
MGTKDKFAEGREVIIEGLGKGPTDRDVSASSSRVRVICVACASRAFSMSSLRMDGMSRINCPLEIFWIVVVESFLIILKASSEGKGI